MILLRNLKSLNYINCSDFRTTFVCHAVSRWRRFPHIKTPLDIVGTTGKGQERHVFTFWICAFPFEKTSQFLTIKKLYYAISCKLVQEKPLSTYYLLSLTFLKAPKKLENFCLRKFRQKGTDGSTGSSLLLPAEMNPT